MSSEMNAMVIMAQMMPEYKLIELLEEAISKYKEAQLLNYPVETIKDKQMNMSFYCLLLEVKIVGNDKDPFAMTKEMDKIHRVYEMLNPNQG
jgi:hypothetical protein